MIFRMGNGHPLRLQGIWLAANTLTGIIAVAAPLIDAPLFAGVGLIGGVLQWFALRHTASFAASWMFVCALRAVVGLALGGGVWFVLATSIQMAAFLIPARTSLASWAGSLLIPMGAAVTGLVLGGMQVYTRRASVLNGRRWVGWSTVAFAMASLVLLAHLAVAPSTVSGTLIAGALGGLIYGAMTAPALHTVIR
jgi:hypothetical protein